MRPDEYADYTAARDHEYVASLSASMSEEAAWQKVRADRARLLPDGLATEGHRLLVAEDHAGRPVGSLWLGLSDPRTGSPDTAWLFDIHVEPQRRREGFGRAMLTAVEATARDLGAKHLALNVFAENTAAVAMYQSTGYRVASQQLLKEL